MDSVEASLFKRRAPPALKPYQKATNIKITRQFLSNRQQHSERVGWQKQKWVWFCEQCLDRGYQVFLYEARRTVSKYITVKCNNQSYKVRFSNHAPIKHRELQGDCDFFVGKTNLATTTTDQALGATIRFFEGRKRPPI